MLGSTKAIGHKILESVTIFSFGDDKPILIWRLTDYMPQWGLIKDDFERQWLKKHDQSGDHSYPDVRTSQLLGHSSDQASSGQPQPGQSPTHFPGPAANSFVDVDPCDDDDLRPFVNKGRNAYANWILADINRAPELMRQYLGTDARSGKWQRTWYDVSSWRHTWTATDISRGGLATVYFPAHQLDIVPEDQTRNWQEPRQAAVGMFPNGPNIRVSFRQDYPYRLVARPNELAVTNIFHSALSLPSQN